MSIVSVDNIQPIGSGTTVTVNKSVTLESGNTNITGVCTATSFVGDGSNLTGITQTTINSNNNNYLITGTGTANTLQGEANLTFSGDTLTAHMSSATPAIIVGDSNRTGAGQHLAEFRGYWDGNHVARIVYAAGDDTTNKDDGIIKFHTTPSGGGITERLRIDSNGKFCFGTYNADYANNDSVANFVNAASGGTENPLITLWNPTTVADARASIDFLTNAHSGTGRDGAFIRASNDGSTAKAHLIFGTILDETYTKTVKFDTNGDVELVDGDLVIQTSGHGIDFSARSGSNAGATSSILDDYEEGVYQPTMTGSSGGSHTFVTYTHLAYTKVGRVVHIQGYINTNGGSLSGNLKLSLPFTVSNDATGHSRYAAIGLSWRGHGWSGNTGEITFAPQPNTTYGEFVSVSNNGSHIWVNNTHVNNNYNIRIGGSYITNS